MSKIKDAMMQAEELYGEEFQQALDNEEFDKAEDMLLNSDEMEEAQAHWDRYKRIKQNKEDTEKYIQARLNSGDYRDEICDGLAEILMTDIMEEYGIPDVIKEFREDFNTNWDKAKEALGSCIYDCINWEEYEEPDVRQEAEQDIINETMKGISNA